MGRQGSKPLPRRGGSSCGVAPLDSGPKGRPSSGAGPQVDTYTVRPLAAVESEGKKREAFALRLTTGFGSMNTFAPPTTSE
jgi:hypothetical protein